ncbi:MAG: GNAT family N-acetyltransferase [Bacteroidota bacterium]
MDIEISKLDSTDIDHFSDLIKIFEEVFEWGNFSVPSRQHLQGVLENLNFLVFVAIIDKKLVGGLTAYILDRYDIEKPSAYIYDIAVLTDRQRKGIGKLLIKTFNSYCEKNGFDEVFVQAETHDIQAVNFYKATSITSQLKATHFTYSFYNKRKSNDA